MQNLLFVDDENNYLKAMERMLHKQKALWNIFSAQSVDQALALTRTIAFDVIISDVNMPEKSGFDLLKSLQKARSTRTIPVIILTANSEGDLKRKALELGATDLLNKPVSYEDLVARITSALRLKSYQDELIYHNLSLETKVKERTLQLDHLHQDLIWRLAKAGELRDEETGDHVVRVGHYSRIIAQNLNLSQEEIDLIFLTAPLHDLGKIGIPDAILLKKNKLTKTEWTAMKTHCKIGADILLEKPKGMKAFYALKEEENPLPWIQDPLKTYAAIIAMTHHEKWDGSGYPGGLKKKEIPIQGRIVAFADVYDALRSKRPYKDACSAEHTWRTLEQAAGSHLDPDIFESIQTLQPEFESILARYNDL
ncbi:MAG: response regulator [Proteobacteria bacterium]|nr:response regulator [Desulfobacula sp.]MBU4130638.1 response regulator [Pseudomonadota bacterium]